MRKWIALSLSLSSSAMTMEALQKNDKNSLQRISRCPTISFYLEGSLEKRQAHRISQDLNLFIKEGAVEIKSLFEEILRKKIEDLRGLYDDKRKIKTDFYLGQKPFSLNLQPFEASPNINIFSFQDRPVDWYFLKKSKEINHFRHLDALIQYQIQYDRIDDQFPYRYHRPVFLKFLRVLERTVVRSGNILHLELYDNSSLGMDFCLDLRKLTNLKTFTLSAKAIGELKMPLSLEEIYLVGHKETSNPTQDDRVFIGFGKTNFLNLDKTLKRLKSLPNLRKVEIKSSSPLGKEVPYLYPLCSTQGVAFPCQSSLENFSPSLRVLKVFNIQWREGFNFKRFNNLEELAFSGPHFFLPIDTSMFPQSLKKLLLAKAHLKPGANFSHFSKLKKLEFRDLLIDTRFKFESKYFPLNLEELLLIRFFHNFHYCETSLGEWGDIGEMQSFFFQSKNKNGQAIPDLSKLKIKELKIYFSEPTKINSKKLPHTLEKFTLDGERYIPLPDVSHLKNLAELFVPYSIGDIDPKKLPKSLKTLDIGYSRAMKFNKIEKPDQFSREFKKYQKEYQTKYKKYEKHYGNLSKFPNLKKVVGWDMGKIDNLPQNIENLELIVFCDRYNPMLTKFLFLREIYIHRFSSSEKPFGFGISPQQKTLEAFLKKVYGDSQIFH